MQKQFGAPSEEMRLTGVHFRRTLIFFHSFQGTPFAFLNFRKLGVQVRVVSTGKLGSNGGFVRRSWFCFVSGRVARAVRFASQRSGILRQSIAAGHNTIRPMPAERGRIGDARNGERGFVGKFNGARRVLGSSPRLCLCKKKRDRLCFSFVENEWPFLPLLVP